jgi:thioredoxin-related protein
MHSMIKYLGFILGMAIFSLTVQASEIDFLKGSFEEATTQAKAEKKLIFIDAYAVWCGPCKMMDRNTFNDPELAEYFNENFVNFKLDVEKGEGPALSGKFGVNAMPTLLFVNYKGKVISKTIGYRGPKELMKLAMKANTPANNQDQYALAYEEGSNDPEVLFHYSMNQAKAGQNYLEAAEKYFATQKTKDLYKKEQNWKAIEALTTDIDSREFQYLMQKQKKFMRKYGVQPVADKIYEVLKSYVLQAALLGNRDKMVKAVTTAQDKLKDKGQTASRLKMVYAEARKDWKDYAQKASYHYENYIITAPKDLDKSAWIFYQHVNDEKMLNDAIQWAKQSVAIENEYYNNKTLAYLLYKTGQADEARKAANKAIKIAELNNESTAEMESLLNKI